MILAETGDISPFSSLAQTEEVSDYTTFIVVSAIVIFAIFVVGKNKKKGSALEQHLI